jgi:hypothetical protein
LKIVRLILKVEAHAGICYIDPSLDLFSSHERVMGHIHDVSSNAEATTITIQSNEELKHKPKKWYYYLWDTLDKPKEERWFMFKLDAALLTFASLGMTA